MDTNNLKFKTNINCAGCVKAVTPYLNQTEGIVRWEVNTESEHKILTVQTTGITQEQVIDIVKKAGFSIEKLNN